MHCWNCFIKRPLRFPYDHFPLIVLFSRRSCIKNLPRIGTFKNTACGEGRTGLVENVLAAGICSTRTHSKNSAGAERKVLNPCVSRSMSLAASRISSMDDGESSAMEWLGVRTWSVPRSPKECGMQVQVQLQAGACAGVRVRVGCAFAPADAEANSPTQPNLGFACNTTTANAE